MCCRVSLVLWCKGSVTLSDVGRMFDKDLLSQLKCEHGGLQTVLKNCADVFRSECLLSQCNINECYRIASRHIAFFWFTSVC